MPSKIPITPARLRPAVRRDLERLAKLLAKERGHAVSRSDAISTAVTEAVRRRAGSPPGPSPA
jgi:hypothetical protein